jgi:two-component system, OmpR family, response regulator
MDTRPHIIVVDDEKDIRELVHDYLTGEGYRVSLAGDGESMRRIRAQTPADLVILDLVLPGEDGLALARSLREESNVGIIMLTGRSETVDRIIGLEMGADDYLPKPFHLRELLARVKSVLRRASARTGAPEAPAASRSKARFAGWNLDLTSRELVSPAGEEVRLTTGEFDLLAAFIAHASQVLSRDRLLDLARNREGGPFDRTIDVQVGRLRRKLEPDPQNPTMIKTVRGTGYIFTPPVEMT